MIAWIVASIDKTLPCVISSPEPHIVTNCVTIVDLKHDTGLHTTCSLISNTEKHI